MLILGLIGLLITGSVAIPIDTRLEDYCKALLAIYEKDPESDIVQGIIEPWMCRSLDAMEESDYFLPKVLIWCPLTRFNLPLKCPEHKNTLRTGNWKVSTKMSSEPRLLFDLNGNTLLVARYYVCSSSGIYHRILSSDQLLLEQVQKDLEVPFILSHRSGYTLRFLTHVRVEIGLGINFNDISTSLMKMNYENFMKRRQLMQLLFEHNGKQPSTKYLDKKEFHENPLYSYPSDDHIREMFLMNFRQTKSIYEGDMKKLSARSVSMFHSFKVCSRVGTTRSSDEKWVSGHACLFVVLNELGEIIKWSFCEGDSLDEVKVLLHELSARFSVQGRLLSHIMVGPCCEWRPRLMEIFGGNVLIKQDLHHAVEGLRENLNMQNAVLKACLADFDLVFRDLDDQGQERSKPTPSPQVLKSHLEQFLMKWRDSLSPEAVKRLKAMEEHIHRGCFSGIPPGHGVKKSDDLNELLNKSLVTGATRVGPELAFALITVLFYIMNGKLRRTKQLYERCHPQSPTELDGESFGFLPSGSSVLSPIVSNSLAPQNGQQIQSGEVANLLTTDVLQVLVPEALELHDMLHNLSSRITQNGKTINVWEWPSVRPEKALFLLSCRSFPAEDDSDAAEHTMRLTERLEQFNLDLEPVDQDGNCAFSSVALQIRRILEVGSDPEYNQYLAALGLKETLNLPDMAKCLRFLFVREITANMSEYYPSTHSLTEEMFLEEARSFQFNGVYTSQLGDFMMKALSKMLCCAIVIITSMPSVEVIPFIPPIIKCKTPLFVAHNQRGSGHYDSTVDKPDSDGTSDSGGNNNRYASTKGKCRCGRGKHSGGENVISCTNNSGRGKYLTRCPCHRLQQGCTKMCKCLNCGNEFTTAAAIADMTSQKVMKRKRNVAASKKRKKGEDFINELRQQTPASQTAWSPFESCVFESSLRFLTYSGIELSTENVLQMYNFIAKSTPVSTMGLELRGKTFTQIEVKLSSRQESVPVAEDITITYALDDINGENFT